MKNNDIDEFLQKAINMIKKERIRLRWLINNLLTDEAMATIIHADWDGTLGIPGAIDKLMEEYPDPRHGIKWCGFPQSEQNLFLSKMVDWLCQKLADYPPRDINDIASSSMAEHIGGVDVRSPAFWKQQAALNTKDSVRRHWVHNTTRSRRHIAEHERDVMTI